LLASEMHEHVRSFGGMLCDHRRREAGRLDANKTSNGTQKAVARCNETFTNAVISTCHYGDLDNTDILGMKHPTI
jgi:hypothetical protein